MDNETLILKIPKAANELGESAKKIEEAMGQLAASMQTLKVAAEANLRASKELREAVDELKRRAEKREGKKGKQ